MNKRHLVCRKMPLVLGFAWVLWLFFPSRPGISQPHAVLSFEAVLRPDNALEVVVDIRGSETNPLTYAVDLGGLEGIRDIGVEALAETGRQNVPFSITRSGRTCVISWGSPPAQSPGGFRLRYVLLGVVGRGERSDEFNWNMLSGFQEFFCDYVKATIAVPAYVSKEASPVIVRSGAEVTRCQKTLGQLKIEAVIVPPGSPLGVQCRLSGVVEGRFFWNRFMKTVGGTALMLFLPLAVFGVLFPVYWLRGRDPHLRPFEAEDSRPPEAITPEVAAAIRSEHVETRDILAAAVDLARLGFLKLTLTGAEPARITEVRVEAVRSFESLPPARRAIAELMTRAADASLTRAFSVEKCAPRSEVEEAREKVYAQAVRDGFFRADPEMERWAYSMAGVVFLGIGACFLASGSVSWTLLACATGFLMASMAAGLQAARTGRVWIRVLLFGAAMVCLSGGLLLIAANPDKMLVTWTAKVGWGLGLAAGVFFCFSPLMPQRTVRGAAEKSRLIAYKTHLKSLRLEDLDAAGLQGEFERGLPFAVVFRYRKEWINRFAACGALTPAWWTTEMASASDGTLTGQNSCTLLRNREPFIETLSILSSALGESPEAGVGG
ncbi:MAG: DUF2207 domain-containing protein [Lentisphaerae bacterium]|nr:DUF2207 domain-containing protein [Lentisphaerota bacterium]